MGFCCCILQQWFRNLSFFRVTANPNSCYFIESFSAHYYSTTPHLHSVINLMHHSSATYLLSFSAHYYSTTSHLHSVINLHLPLLQYIWSAFSRQLTRITHLLHTYHYYSTTSHLHSVINLHAPLIWYILTIIFPICYKQTKYWPLRYSKRCYYLRRCFTVYVNRRWAISKIWF